MKNLLEIQQAEARSVVKFESLPCARLMSSGTHTVSGESLQIALG